MQQWVQRRLDLNEYEREQAAPGLKVTSRTFGLGRKIPIAQRYVDQRFARLAKRDESVRRRTLECGASALLSSERLRAIAPPP